MHVCMVTDSWHGRLLQDFLLKLFHPLTNLLSPNVDYMWTPECQHVLKSVKSLLSCAPVLADHDVSRQNININRKLMPLVEKSVQCYCRRTVMELCFPARIRKRKYHVGITKLFIVKRSAN